MSTHENDQRIDYIEFPSTDIERSKRFFGEAFGWTFTDYGPEYSSFRDGRLSGGFRLEQSVPESGPLVVLYAVELEATRDRVVKAGAMLTKPIFEFPGGRRFQFRDPVGNELAVWSDR